MTYIEDAVKALEVIAPQRWAMEWDKVGLQVGELRGTLTHAVVSLDRSLAAIQCVKDSGAQLLMTHHPLLLKPASTFVQQGYEERAILELINHGMAMIAAHTNWDAAPGGINDTLAHRLGLLDTSHFGNAALVSMLKMVVTAPAESAESIISSAGNAGAGQFAAYAHCAFIQPGTGYFKALLASKPVVGRTGHTNRVDEVRIEMTLRATDETKVKNAIRQVHPYETPVTDFYTLQPQAEQPIARIGHLCPEMHFRDFRQYVSSKLETETTAWGNPERKVKFVAVCGGSASELWRVAQEAGADVLVTGEVKQHHALEAAESGLCLIQAGHYATEQPGCEALRTRLEIALPSVTWTIFTPKRGQSGRPL